MTNCMLRLSVDPVSVEAGGSGYTCAATVDRGGQAQIQAQIARAPVYCVSQSDVGMGPVYIQQVARILVYCVSQSGIK